MDENISSDQILGYLKGKYLSKGKSTPISAPENDVNGKDKETIPTGDESDLSGEEAENKFLLSKLERVQGELTKWLDILKTKINHS